MREVASIARGGSVFHPNLCITYTLHLTIPNLHLMKVRLTVAYLSAISALNPGVY